MTDRHRFYLALFSLFGVLAGLFAGILVAIVIALVLTGFGCSVMVALEKVYKHDKWYTLYMAAGIGAVIVGLCVLAGAAIFLVLHEAGAV